jgi:hypothetical protein
MSTCYRLLYPLALAISLSAAQAEPAADACDLHIAGGPAGKVYELMIRDLRAVCGAEVHVCPVASSGGLQNLTLLSANEAELGIVQVDTLRQMGDGGDETLKSLQVVLPLHANLLHVLTLAEGSHVDVRTVPWIGTPVPLTGKTQRFDKLSGLRGRSVIAVGSAQLLAAQIEAQHRLGWTVRAADSDDEALRALRAGQVQAVLTLGGWPLPVVARQRNASGLMLADFDLQPSAPYAVLRRSYQNLDAFNLRFLAAPNVLMTRAFKPEGATGRKVQALQRCVKQRLDELQEGRYHPAWKEIKDISATYGLPPLSAPTVPTARGVRSGAKAL